MNNQTLEIPVLGALYGGAHDGDPDTVVNVAKVLAAQVVGVIPERREDVFGPTARCVVLLEGGGEIVSTAHPVRMMERWLAARGAGLDPTHIRLWSAVIHLLEMIHDAAGGGGVYPNNEDVIAAASALESDAIRADLVHLESLSVLPLPRTVPAVELFDAFIFAARGTAEGESNDQG